MKLNNKGFAISSIMYLILVLAITLVVLTLSIFSSRRLMLNAQKESVIESVFEDNLPEGYERLSYIESTGTQYINTGITLTPESSSALYLDIEFTNPLDDWFAGANCFSQLHYTNSIITIRALTSGDNEEQIPFPKRGNIYIEQSGKTIDLYVNDKKNEKTWEQNTCTDNYTLFLFALGNAGGTLYGSTKLSAKLYSAKVYNEGTLVRNFIPCSQDDVVGMYDLVTETFYTNASGIGTFTAGTY